MSNILSPSSCAKAVFNTTPIYRVVLKNGNEITARTVKTMEKIAHEMSTNEFVTFDNFVIRTSEIELICNE